MSALRAAARVKPVVVMKAGRSLEARGSLAFHTGSLVGGDDVFDAAMRRAGVLRIRDLHAVLQRGQHAGRGRAHAAAGGSASSPMPAGPGRWRRIARRTASCSWPGSTRTTLAPLRALLPPSATDGNPVYVRGDAAAQQYAEAARIVLQDPKVDALLAILTPFSLTAARTDRRRTGRGGARTAQAGLHLLAGRRVRGQQPPAVRRQPYPHLPDARSPRSMRSPRWPCSPPTRSSCCRCRRRSRPTSSAGPRHRAGPAAGRPRGRQRLARIRRIRSSCWRRSAFPWCRAGRRIRRPRPCGWPMRSVTRSRIKILSPDIAHKTDVGGVRLGRTRRAQRARRLREHAARRGHRAARRAARGRAGRADVPSSGTGAS